MPLTPRQRGILEKADHCRRARQVYVRALHAVENSEHFLPSRAVHEAEDAWHKSEVDLLAAVQEEG